VHARVLLDVMSSHAVISTFISQPLVHQA